MVRWGHTYEVRLGSHLVSKDYCLQYRDIERVGVHKETGYSIHTWMGGEGVGGGGDHKTYV